MSGFLAFGRAHEVLTVLGSIVMIWRNAGLRREFLMKYQFVPIGEEWKFVKVP